MQLCSTVKKPLFILKYRYVKQILMNEKKGSLLIKFPSSTHFYGMPPQYQTLKTIMNNAESLTVTLPCALKALTFQEVKALSPEPGISFLMGLLVSTHVPSNSSSTLLSFQLNIALWLTLPLASLPITIPILPVIG